MGSAGSTWTISRSFSRATSPEPSPHTTPTVSRLPSGTITAPDGSGRQIKVITVDDVVAYLKAHPNFFENHAELAEAMSLVPRVQGPGVIDMQQAILKRLRSEIDRLKNERTEIIANSKQNQIVQNRIQAAVISIIQATTFEKMIHVVTHELPELLDVDFITLAIEANADAPKRVPVRGVYVLAPGAIDAAIRPDKHARLRSHIPPENPFSGPHPPSLQSHRLIPPQLHPP